MHVISHATIIFVDIRGFSEWCEHVNVSQLLEEFLGTYYAHITAVFSNSYIKPLGDGAMIIEECEIPQTEEDVTELLNNILDKIYQTEVLFSNTCIKFGIQSGEESLLRLGWGVTRGFVALLTPKIVTGMSDYVSVDINKCAKLCKKAKPAGIVIDKVDFSSQPQFPHIPKYSSFVGERRVFQADSFTMDGMNVPIPVWSSLTPESAAVINGPERISNGSDTVCTSSE